MSDAMPSEGAPDAASPAEQLTASSVVAGSIRVPLMVIASVAAVAALYSARGFVIPVLTAFFLAYTLQPVVNRLQAWHVPRVVGALLVLFTLLGTLVATTFALREDALQALESLPGATRRFADSLDRLHSNAGNTVHALERVTRELVRVVRSAQKLSTPGTGSSNQVVVASPSTFGDLILSGSATALSALATLALSLLLVFYLLQAGDTFRRKLVRVVGPRLSTRRATLEVLNDISVQVQSYMFTLFATNVILALSGWAVYRALGLEHAAVWAIVAAMLHLIPYVGTLLGVSLTAVAAFTQSGSFTDAASVAGAGIALATVVGMFLHTWMSGRQARMNPTAIFVALLFFGWLWGAWGLLLGIPLIVCCKVVSERVDALHTVAELLSE